MKAREYIADVQAARETGVPEAKIIHTLLSRLLAEGRVVATRRAGSHTPHDGIMLPVLREFDLKWRAIARACDWNPNGWKEFWAEKGVQL